MRDLLMIPFCLLSCLSVAAMEPVPARGMTISCQGYGREWGTDQFAGELDRLKAMGINSVTIHPYARIDEDGTVSWRDWSEDNPPHYFVRPILEAHARGMTIMIKPHLAYWGTSFSWRGAIQFTDPGARERFFQTYRRWITTMARVCVDADVFVVGTELEGFFAYEGWWNETIAEIRMITRARLTYAANWDSFSRVKFWKKLDLIGVQGYFPISKEPNPDRETLLKGWQPIIGQLRDLSQKEQRPVIFTEFGYNRSLRTAEEPWSYSQDHQEEAEQLQALCLEVGLQVLASEKSWFHGAYLWKWFAGPAPRANFRLDTPRLRQVIENAWRLDLPVGTPTKKLD